MPFYISRLRSGLVIDTQDIQKRDATSHHETSNREFIIFHQSLKASRSVGAKPSLEKLESLSHIFLGLIDESALMNEHIPGTYEVNLLPQNSTAISI